MIPKIVDIGRFLVVGVREVAGMEKSAMLSLLKECLFPRLGEISGKEGDHIYNVFGFIPNAAAGDFEYVAGVRTNSLEGIPEGMVGWSIAGGSYAVEKAAGIDGIAGVYAGMVKAIAASEYELLGSPCFVIYDRNLSPDDGKAVWTLHVPVRDKKTRSDLDNWV